MIPRFVSTPCFSDTMPGWSGVCLPVYHTSSRVWLAFIQGIKVGLPRYPEPSILGNLILLYDYRKGKHRFTLFVWVMSRLLQSIKGESVLLLVNKDWFFSETISLCLWTHGLSYYPSAFSWRRKRDWEVTYWQLFMLLFMSILNHENEL